MAKYSQEIKDRAAEAAKNGMHLKEIQATIGPNPAATKRYLAKQGIVYADLFKELKAKNQKPETLVEKSVKKKKVRDAKKKVAVEPISDLEFSESFEE